MNIIEQAFHQIYPEKEMAYNTYLNYSGKFKPYNANVKLYRNNLTFNLSKEWKTVNREIRIGLIQSLLIRILKQKKHTTNISLYDSFIRNISSLAPITHIDPSLKHSFERINQKYFYNTMDMPNLKWGSRSTVKLGSYEYQTNTIRISSVLKGSQLALDYVMYHEMLHKKHQFYTKNGRSYYHTSRFKKQEKEFIGLKNAEAEIRYLCRKAPKKPDSFFKLLKKAKNNFF
ncbi:hypothetical protein GF336_02665 [Candidatus Woesearchaeota archaeon]|nr:hypothetical protein [Candidatus Woesearchaeota archaeon]